MLEAESALKEINTMLYIDQYARFTEKENILKAMTVSEQCIFQIHNVLEYAKYSLNRYQMAPEKEEDICEFEEQDELQDIRQEPEHNYKIKRKIDLCQTLEEIDGLKKEIVAIMVPGDDLNQYWKDKYKSIVTCPCCQQIKPQYRHSLTKDVEGLPC